jgi:hypothetical protein
MISSTAATATALNVAGLPIALATVPTTGPTRAPPMAAASARPSSAPRRSAGLSATIHARPPAHEQAPPSAGKERSDDRVEQRVEEHSGADHQDEAAASVIRSRVALLTLGRGSPRTPVTPLQHRGGDTAPRWRASPLCEFQRTGSSFGQRTIGAAATLPKTRDCDAPQRDESDRLVTARTRVARISAAIRDCSSTSTTVSTHTASTDRQEETPA